jgi:hypothetical protein
MFDTYFSASDLPMPPLMFGKPWLVNEWNIFSNDKVGDCVLAGAAHETILWRAEAGTPVEFTDASVLSDYSAVTGYDPANPDSDQGTDMQVAASYRLKTGVSDKDGTRHKIDAYVALSPGNLDQVALAAFLFGAVGVGIQFPSSAFDQFDHGEPWDPVAGSHIINGHYIPCLRGDTCVSLLNGTEVPIKDLVGTDQWIYALNDKHQVVPALATNIRRTKQDVKLVRICLDNGEHFDCTPDHLIMLRDGNYLRADELSIGKSLMPLYRRNNKFGYEEVMHPQKGKWQLTHRCVAQQFHQLRRKKVVHHIDFDKRNNRPDNFRIMSLEDHARLHQECSGLLNQYAKSDIGRERSREIMSGNWENSQFRARHDAHLRNNLKLQEHRKNGDFSNFDARSANGKKTGATNIRFAHTPEIFARRRLSLIARLKNDPEFLASKREIARANGSKTARLTNEQISHIAKRLEGAPRGIGAALAAEFGVARSLITKIKQGRYVNHKVTAIEYLPGTHDVFDLEVPVYHNFAISPGVFVHNCVGRNRAGNFLCVTWGRLHAITPGFLMEYMDEGIAFLSFERLRGAVSPQGFDAATLQSDLALLKAKPTMKETTMATTQDDAATKLIAVKVAVRKVVSGFSYHGINVGSYVTDDEITQVAAAAIQAIADLSNARTI